MLRSFEFFQVDAFTRQALHGNACAIIYDADCLTDAEMLAIAREMNLSETAFVLKSAKADFRFRFFTPAEEIPLAGHPTIATVHSLIEQGRIAADCHKIIIELAAGVIEVAIEKRDSGHFISMTQLPPRFLQIYAPDLIALLFGLAPSDFLPDAPIQTVSTGTPMLMIPLRDRQALERIAFQSSAFATFQKQSDFSSAHLFCLSGFTPQGDTAARHFCAPPDVQEDAFTGSASGAMGCYLWKYRLIKKMVFTGEQGHLMQRPGTAEIRVLAKDDRISGPIVGGYAVTCLRGKLEF